jgi:hypothetical protein
MRHRFVISELRESPNEEINHIRRKEYEENYTFKRNKRGG